MNKNKRAVFSKRISIHILSRFITTLVIYSVSIILIFLLGVRVASGLYWDGTELIYPLLNFINRNSVSVLMLLFIIGFVITFIYYWIKTLGYLQIIVTATQNIYNDKVGLIELPSELKEVENQMNQIKLNVSDSKRVAKEAEQRKNDLVVYLAHDLKTPLTSVIGYLTLLRDETQISDELREKYLSISLDKAQRLEDLINEFFEITRFNLSNIILEPTKVNLTRMLEQLVYEFRPMLLDKELECSLNAPPDLMIKCDVDKIQRVFDNLLRNAVNYSFEKSSIDICVSIFNNSIIINFINRGNTIPREKLDRIFEQFYRLDTARITKTGGAGLGLAIAREIAELHGGKITANSENELINFELTIPVL